MTAAPNLTDSAKPVQVALPTRNAVLDATDRAVRRLVEDLGAIPEQAWSNRACGEWTIDQTVAHISIGPLAFCQMVEQMATGGVTELFDATDPEFSEAQTELMGTAEPFERIESVSGAFAQFAESAWEVPSALLSEPTWTPEGIMPAAAALAIGLNELSIHGYEIRSAAGLDPLPDEGNPAELAAFTLHACSGLIREGGWPAIEVVLGDDEPVLLAWSDGRVVLDADSTPEVRLETTAGLFALMLWGRLTLDDAMARFDAKVDGGAEGVRDFFAASRPF